MPEPERMPPEIEGYTFQRLIGRGGFSDVYLYRQHMPSRDVAVKVLRTEDFSEASRAQFAAEANLMARVSSHTAIASIFAADVDDEGEPYLVMEYCPGGSLGGIYRKSPLSVARTLRLGVRLASALECAHRVGIVHRDVKPANILFTEYDMAVLSDFGISTIDDEFPEATLARQQVYSGGIEDSTTVGMSLPWAAPESLGERPVADTRSDRFSLAATLYTLVEGRSPREVPDGPNGATAIRARIQSGFIAQMQRPGVPEPLQDVLRQGMSYDPGQRFSSMLELARALQQVQRELGGEVTPVEVPGAEAYDDDPHLGGSVTSSGGGNNPDGVGSSSAPSAPSEATWLPADAALPAEAGGRPDPDSAGRGSAASLPPPSSRDRVPLPPPPGPGGAPGAGHTSRPAQEHTGPSGPEYTGFDPRTVDPHRHHTVVPAGGPASSAPSAAPPIMPMTPQGSVGDQGSGRTKKMERGALIAAVVFVVVALVVGSSLLIRHLQEPRFTGEAIDNLTVTETSADAYDITIPDGLELPEELQVRVLEPGEGTALGEFGYALVSVDHSTWPPGETITLNPWASDVAGENVGIDARDLRTELDLAEDVELRPGTILLAVAPRAYFANRAPDLGITAGDSVLAVITIVS
ncbi:MAG TPA: serine/threonine protein kinase [Candidatus Ruania gallistercoris]|uniref:non-specific serine/threonine protein kinase n=1 Tax=Candidatus Ruania gallistercoris TaxID=2838746 RepID=A0A9D2EER4_9MICO|nr:serine/threonine protein kinase [Candidatus Ruania gallistercoris]